MSASLGNDGVLGVGVKAKSKLPFLLSSKAYASCSQLNSTIFVKYVQEVSSGLINLRIWFLVVVCFLSGNYCPLRHLTNCSQDSRNQQAEEL